jgi:hypothetical protein
VRGGDALRVLKDKLLFEVLGGDFIEGTRGHARGGKAQFFCLGQNLFVLQA